MLIYIIELCPTQHNIFFSIRLPVPKYVKKRLLTEQVSYSHSPSKYNATVKLEKIKIFRKYG